MPVQSVMVFVVLALAIARITGLIATDDITAPIRNRIVYRQGRVADRRGKIADLITCQWCVSIWVAAVLVVAAHLWSGHLWFSLIATGLACSQVTGMLSKLGRS
jgi:hypothetical protein